MSYHTENKPHDGHLLPWTLGIAVCLVVVGMVMAVILLPSLRDQQAVEAEVSSTTTSQVFILTEADGYIFPAGTWRDEQVAQLVHGQLLPKIVQQVRDHGFNEINIVGFTDGTAIHSGTCSGWDNAYVEALQKR